MKNFWIRLCSSVTLVLIAFVTIIKGGELLAVVLLLISLIAYRELLKAFKLTDAVKKWSFCSLELVGHGAIIIYYLVMYDLLADNKFPLFKIIIKDHLLLLLILVIALIIFMAIYVFTFPKYHIRQIMEAFFSIIYAPVMLSCIYMIREGLAGGGYFVWVIFICSWVCDSCAYCVGMLFGHHKLVPTLSPQKSLEGSLGGILGAMIVGALYSGLFVGKDFPEMKYFTLIIAICCGIGAVVSQIGDLAASAIKRNYELKDFGKLIPGHGGIMDRFDSVIFTAPFICIVLYIIDMKLSNLM